MKTLIVLFGLMAQRSEPVMSTFSIAARDEATGDFGVAVQSKFFNVGAYCPWAKAGVGAVVTQASANYFYGSQGLKMLEEGLTAQQVVERLTSLDDQRDHRQLAVVDNKGNVAAWTGKSCVNWAGHRTGPSYSVQGNILAGEAVVKQMERAFLDAKGSFADRLVASLEAGQGAGGDKRGKQSAALLIVRPNSVFGSDRHIDLRVDDHREPIQELARLVAHYQVRDESFRAAQIGRNDPAAGIEALRAALKKYEADDGAHLILARLYARIKNPSAARTALRRALELNPNLRGAAEGDEILKALLP